jgi:hypothetical protein
LELLETVSEIPRPNREKRREERKFEIMGEEANFALKQKNRSVRLK